MSSRRRDIYSVYIRILQNGHKVAEGVYPFGIRKNIDITSGFSGDLSLPLYPLPSKRLRIIQIKKNFAQLNLSGSWSGFLVTSGEYTEILEKHTEERHISMLPGDYVTILLHDLRILIKIAPSAMEETIKHDKRYQGQFSSLFIRHPSERASFFSSVVIAAILLSSVVFGLLKREAARPHVFEELADSYTLPFIHKENLITAPEALMENMERRNIIYSVVALYRSFVESYMGWDFKKSPYVYQTTIDRMKESFAEAEENLLLYEKSIDKKKPNPSTNEARIYSPAAIGPTLDDQLYYIATRMNNYHESLRYKLEKRREISKIFPKDPDYDWIDYKKQNRVTTSAAISRIRVFTKKDNEARMYDEASRLAAKAERYQALRNKNKLDEEGYSFEKQRKVLVFKRNFDLLIPVLSTPVEDRYVTSLEGSSLQPKLRDRILEPLIGHIDRGLVSAIIQKNAYKINLCYEKVLRINRHIKGDISLSWRINTDGVPSQVELQSASIRDPILISCLEGHLLSWRFPKASSGSVKITHRFSFMPRAR